MGKFKVAVLGAAGGIGQPLSMLMKMNPMVSELSLYDVFNTPGVAADLSHMSTAAKVKGYLGPDQLADALTGCNLVIIPAGVPRKPGMTRDDLFNINAGIVKGLCEQISKSCPNAWVAIISNPVNSTVPIACEVFQAAGTLDASKVFGVTTLDVVRAEAFIAELAGVDPKDVTVPVVGGHAGITILPLLSQASPKPPVDDAGMKALSTRIQNAGTEVVEAKAGTGSATLSMAYAAARFAESCLKAMSGQPGVTEYAYVQSSVVPGVPYFASKLSLGENGVTEYIPLPAMDAAETQGMEALKEELLGSINKGVEFVKNPPAPKQ